MNTIDTKTKQFYLDMGYTTAQINRAQENSIKLGIDILDALNLPDAPTHIPPQPPAPLVPVQPQAQSQPKSFSYRNDFSFLTPWRKIRHT